METRLIEITCISYFSFTKANKSNNEPNKSFKGQKIQVISQQKSREDGDDKVTKNS